MSKDKEYNTVTISNDDTAFGPVYSIGSQNVQGYFDSTVTLPDPVITYNSRDLLKDFKEAQFTIQVLKDVLEEMGIDIEKRLEQKKFMNKLSGEENGKI
jgi:hypothetical protein